MLKDLYDQAQVTKATYMADRNRLNYEIELVKISLRAHLVENGYRDVSVWFFSMLQAGPQYMVYGLNPDDMLGYIKVVVPFSYANERSVRQLNLDPMRHVSPSGYSSGWWGPKRVYLDMACQMD